MATYTRNDKNKTPVKLTLTISDLINAVKYRKEFFSWTTVQEIKAYIKSKNGTSIAKQKLFFK
jgi:hypothetical protein